MDSRGDDFDTPSHSSRSENARSALRGTRTSGPELRRVGQDGFWILVDDREMFLPFDAFPWFRNVSVASLTRIERPAPQHLRWPDLDVDLTLDSIECPDSYPLVDRRG